MWDAFFSWIDKVATGKKQKTFWAVAIALLVVVWIAYPQIDANILFYNRIEKRIDNLQKLVAIGGIPIEESPLLLEEYESILDEMKTSRENPQANSSASEREKQIKFWSGAGLGIVIGLASLFSKSKNGPMTLKLFISQNLLACLAGVLVAFVFGKLFALAPTLGVVWVNCILAPILQFKFFELLLSNN